MEGTFWALIPAVIAIVLALITKQVYISLFLGIFTGAMFLAGGNPIEALGNIFNTMAEEIGGSGCIIIFLVMLGILVVLMNKAGGSRAYGNWASRKIKSEKGALGATAGLGFLIFVDDYFNCLTVGSVMRPVTDRFKISRSKLAYIIDATAAPVCIIAPISSWAAAVSAKIPETYTEINGFSLFLKAIPFNLYALLTIIFVILVVCLNLNFGLMAKHERIAKKTGDLNGGSKDAAADEDVGYSISNKGKVIDLVLPVILLILFCIGSMIYTGMFIGEDGFQSTPTTTSIIEAFANCNSSLALCIGSTLAVVCTALLYLPRRVLSFREFTDSFTQGFKAMVPAILILTFAWTLSSISGALDLSGFVSGVIDTSSNLLAIFPVIFFVIALGISFATGTSWGTFGILIPIAFAIFVSDAASATVSNITIICISAILAGAVCGDHISPISDTTILASSGANSNHINHVNTQLPYALTVALISACGFVVAGFCATEFASFWVSAAITWGASLLLLAGIVLLIFASVKKKRKRYAAEDLAIASAPVPVEAPPAEVRSYYEVNRYKK